MKKFLCLLLCLVLFASTAFAVEMPVPRKFRNQVITGGSGVKGTLSLTASGAAEWLEYLLPFTAAEFQVRLIGQAHGKYTESNTDDDAWQLRLYAEDAQGEAQATTRVYGDPSGIYLTSELLPDTLLRLPVSELQLPYALLDSDYLGLLTAFDPFGLMDLEKPGNPAAYSAVSGLMQIPEAEWAEKWAPVLEKYDAEMEMWLAGYAAEPVVSGGTGAMTVKTTYRIPGANLKAQAKTVIGMMLYDPELLALLEGYFTPEQKALYLNPELAYFYEYCIDALPLEGDVLLGSEMSALGESVGMTVSLPVPELPEELTAPAGEFLARWLNLPYQDLLSDIDRVSYVRSAGDVTINAASAARTVSVVFTDGSETADAANITGYVRIDPAAGSTEAPLAASFAFKTSHTVTDEESGARHDDTTLAMSIAPDLTLLDEDDPFRSSYIDFAPLGLEIALEYFTRTPQAENTATRLEIALKLQLPDAEVGLEADLRTASSWALENLLTVGAEDVLTLTEDRKATLLEMLRSNAIGAMVQLNTPAMPDEPVADESVAEEPAPDAPAEDAAPEITTATDLALPVPTEVPALDGSN